MTRVLLLAAAFTWIGVAIPVHADNDPNKLNLDALIQEGDLLLEEAVRLNPETDRVIDEGDQLDDAEKTLRADSTALSEEIQKYNVAMAALEQEGKEIRTRCPRLSPDVDVVESCNLSSRALAVTANRRAEEGARLEAWQQTLNQNITRQNAARLDWTKRKQENEARVALNRSNLKEWLNRVDKLFASDAFKWFVIQAKNPEQCGPERIGGLATLPPVTALRRAQGCMKAVKVGSARK